MNILIIEDHLITAYGINMTLSAEFTHAVIEQAADGESATELLKIKNFELIVLDIMLPNTDALALMTNIARMAPKSKVLVFTASNVATFASKYFQLGAHGMLYKGSGAEDLILAVKTILRGHNFVPSSIIKSIDTDIKHIKNPFKSLSIRELELMEQLLSGKHQRDIAAIMNIAQNTISTLKSRIFLKLNISNMVQLIEMSQLHEINYQKQSEV